MKVNYRGTQRAREWAAFAAMCGLARDDPRQYTFAAGWNARADADAEATRQGYALAARLVAWADGDCNIDTLRALVDDARAVAEG